VQHLIDKLGLKPFADNIRSAGRAANAAGGMSISRCAFGILVPSAADS